MPDSLLDRAFLERLEQLTLLSQKSFHGLVGGHRTARFAGPGQEFLDHRSFHPGDDLRSVNWRAYLRFERLFLKTFHLEPRVPVRMLLDVSASMQAGSLPGATSKLNYAARLSAALCYIGLVRLETIEIIPFSKSLQRPLAVGGGRHRFHLAESFLRSQIAGGPTDMRIAVREFVQAFPQRSLVIIVSDFLDEAGESLKALELLAEFGHEISLAQVWTPEDRRPSVAGEWELIDSESGNSERFRLDASGQDTYARLFDAHSVQLRSLAQKHGGRYLSLSTDMPLEEAIFGSFTQCTY
jgi:uncharacterized protein (DUF58 family)